MKQIIVSLLDNDLYKYSMGQAIYHQFPQYLTEWTFKCRNKDVYFTPEMVQEIKEQIKKYCGLRYTEEELTYLRNIPWIKDDYVDFLRVWRPNFNDFYIEPEGPKGLVIKTKGTWLNTSQYEIPTLAIVNEVYFNLAQQRIITLEAQYITNTTEKVSALKNNTYNIGVFSEFGTRRRLSRETQYDMIKFLGTEDLGNSVFVGTSNVRAAMEFGLKPVGTMAHEWIMSVGQGNRMINPAYSNWFALDAWVKEYGILNGIALTDTITTDVFCKDFQLTFATLFSGVRHDSGDPIIWGEKMIRHYEELGIDPHTKTLLFSDSLDFARADAINKYFKDKAKVAFGIGTYLSNDAGVTPLNIVMKVTQCSDGRGNLRPVAKISDVEGKGMCEDEKYVEYLQNMLTYRLEDKF